MATFNLRLDRFAEHVALKPGQELTLRGAYVSKFDGSTVDAATTTWPADAPGGASVDAKGLVDFEAGGLRVTSRDPKTHEVVAVATGKEAPACAKLGEEAPCLVLNTLPLAQSRLITMDQWRESLEGQIQVEMVAPPPPPALAPVTDALHSPVVIGSLGLAGLAALFALGWTVRRRQKLSPGGQLEALAARVTKKLATADAALAATVSPVVKKTLEAMRDKRVDPASKEGVRVRELLVRVETRIDETARHEKEAKEQEAADELVLEMESALEAANEAIGAGRRR
ncbi:MAG TPA: hypothetical protein VL400_15805 [Polyangiaceae bacterium]|jgi:hypothetical protein|nr:hypothetical protein [Polyangiaceae bacterium]